MGALLNNFYTDGRSKFRFVMNIQNYSYRNMDETKKGALKQYHQLLRTGLLVGNILPALHPLLTDIEYSRVEGKEENVARVDALIEILLTKANRHFEGFCDILKENGYEHWSNTLREEARQVNGK